MSEEIAIFGGVVLAICLIGGCVSSCTRENMEKEAIQAGVGEYYLTTNFAKDFRWKTNQ